MSDIYIRSAVGASVLLVVFTIGAAMAFPAGPPERDIAFWWWTPPVAVFIGGIALGQAIKRTRPNVGSVSRFGDSRVFRALRWLLAIDMASCGCLSLETRTSPSPGFETNDSETIWVRSTHGAKVRYSPHHREFGRCEWCGQHYTRYRTPHIFEREGESREYWHDDPEPYPDDDREIIDAEVLD